MCIVLSISNTCINGEQNDKKKNTKKQTATTHSLFKCLAPRPLSSRKFDDFPLYTLTFKSHVNNGFNIILKKIIYFYFSKHLFLVHLSRRLKCTIVIIRCPSSGVRRPASVRPSLTFTFSTSFLKPLNRIQRNLSASKISMSSTNFVFSRLIGKTIWPPRALIGWDTFDFFSETTEGNATKLDRKQDLNVLYQVCVFQADRKTKMAAPASDWLRHYWLLLWNRWTEWEETQQEARS